MDMWNIFLVYNKIFSDKNQKKFWLAKYACVCKRESIILGNSKIHKSFRKNISSFAFSLTLLYSYQSLLSLEIAKQASGKVLVGL